MAATPRIDGATFVWYTIAAMVATMPFEAVRFGAARWAYTVHVSRQRIVRRLRRINRVALCHGNNPWVPVVPCPLPQRRASKASKTDTLIVVLLALLTTFLMVILPNLPHTDPII